MAQSQASVSWKGEPGGAVLWHSAGDRTDIGQVLSAWRTAERRLEDLVEASPMRFVVLSEIARLRDEYQRLVGRTIT